MPSAIKPRLFGHPYVKTGSCNRPDFDVRQRKIGGCPLTNRKTLRSNCCEGRNFRKIHLFSKNCVYRRGSCGSIAAFTPARRCFVMVTLRAIDVAGGHRQTARPTWESKQGGFPVLGEMVRMLPMRTCMPRPHGRTSSIHCGSPARPMRSSLNDAQMHRNQEGGVQLSLDRLNDVQVHRDQLRCGVLPGRLT